MMKTAWLFGSNDIYGIVYKFRNRESEKEYVNSGSRRYTDVRWRRDRLNTKRDRILFLLIALLLIGIEFVIGIFVHDRFIRPFGGDIIVVVILYALVRSVFIKTSQPLAVYVFLFSAAYEFTQLIPLVDLLGISNRFIRIVMGSSFSWIDILCYLAGCGLCFGHDMYHCRICQVSGKNDAKPV